MYIFFDTETNGLPISWKAPMSALSNWPRIIQFGWQVYNSKQQLVTESNELIMPDGWEIPSVKNLLDKGYTNEQAIKEADFWVKHKYTTENNAKHGVAMPESLERFLNYYRECKYMIAHNIAFDYPVVGAEMLRYKKASGGTKLTRICTMESSTDFCRIPAPYGKPGYKWPKLEELHRILFRQEFSGAHDALADVRATARCFFELVKRGVIVLP